MPTLEAIARNGIHSVDSSGSLWPAMPTLSEQLVAQEFADTINSGQLSVEDAYRNFWSYEEKPETWGLPTDREWRALLPDWEKILLCMTTMLEGDKAVELVDRVAASYFGLQRRLGDMNYNPLVDGLFFAARLYGASNLPKKKQSPIIDELYRIVVGSDFDPIFFKSDVLDAIGYSGVYRGELIDLWEKGEGSIERDVRNTIVKLGMFKGEVRARMISQPSKLDNFSSHLVSQLNEEEVYKLLVDVPKIRSALVDSLKEEKRYVKGLEHMIRDEEGRLDLGVAEYLAAFNILGEGVINFLKSGSQDEKTKVIRILAKLHYIDEVVLREVITIFEEAEDYMEEAFLKEVGNVKQYSYAKLKAAAAHYLGEMGHFHPALVRRKGTSTFSFEDDIRSECYISLVKLGRYDSLNGLYWSSDSSVKLEIVEALTGTDRLPDEMVSLCKDAILSSDDRLVCQGIWTLEHHRVFVPELVPELLQIAYRYPSTDTVWDMDNAISRWNLNMRCGACSYLSFLGREPSVDLFGYPDPPGSIDFDRGKYTDLLDFCIETLRQRPVKTLDAAANKARIIGRLDYYPVTSKLMYREAIKALYPKRGDKWVPFEGGPNYRLAHKFHKCLKPQGYLAPEFKIEAA